MTGSLLSQRIDSAFELGIPVPEIPKEVTDNLNPALELRPHQVAALERLAFYLGNAKLRAKPAQLLFHMATGSGKTLVMAAAMLMLHAEGYRRFLFIVNSSQIVRKTKANFLEAGSSKHLFAPQLHLGRQHVTVREVETYDGVPPDDVAIVFTTVQGLHMMLRDPKENGLTFDDLADEKLVILSDEAHHLNAETKAARDLDSTEATEVHTWEATIDRIVRARTDNVLLDFTATMDLAHPAIREKHRDRLLYDYPLRRFREDRLSKDIEIRQVGGDTEGRMLGAMIMSQHRRVRAAQAGIGLKPVVMMKSRTIAESAANDAAFHALVRDLTGNHLAAFRAEVAPLDPLLAEALTSLLDARELSTNDLAAELKAEFDTSRVLNVNSPKDLETSQIVLNTLEDDHNPIRVVFAVDKLDEGWDVLNLFDIVRLYDRRDGRTERDGRIVVGRTTMREAQLIGRGARYWPFRDPDDPVGLLHLRRFDANVAHPLRLLEVMHYHCAHNPSYISDIRTALKETGALPDVEKTVTLKLRKSFKATDLYKMGPVYLNGSEPSPRIDETDFRERLEGRRITFSITAPIGTVTSQAFGDGAAVAPAAPAFQAGHARLADLGRHVLRRAADERHDMRFSELRRVVDAPSVLTFLMDEEWAGGLAIEIIAQDPRVEAMSPADRLACARLALDFVGKVLLQQSEGRRGTNYVAHPLASLLTDRTIKVAGPGEQLLSWSESPILAGIDRVAADWHVYDECYGTSVEKEFVRFVALHADALRERFGTFHLVRNERIMRIHRMEDGRPFEPDYLLFLGPGADEAGTVWQIFVEPKGGHLVGADAWKEELLEALSVDAPATDLFQAGPYRIRGLPFFRLDGSPRELMQEVVQLLDIDQNMARDV